MNKFHTAFFHFCVCVIVLGVISSSCNLSHNNETLEVSFFPLLRDRVDDNQTADSQSLLPDSPIEKISAQTEEKRKQFLRDYLNADSEIEVTLIDKSTNKKYQPLQILKEQGQAAFTDLPKSNYELFISIRLKEKKINFIGYQDNFLFQHETKRLYIPLFQAVSLTSKFHIMNMPSANADSAVFSVRGKYITDNFSKTFNFLFGNKNDHPFVKKDDTDTFSMMLPIGKYYLSASAEISGNRYFEKPHQRQTIIGTDNNEIHFSLEKAIFDNIQTTPYFEPRLDHYEFQYSGQSDNKNLTLCAIDSNAETFDHNHANILLKTQTPQLVYIKNSIISFKPDPDQFCMTLTTEDLLNIDTISQNHYSAHISAVFINSIDSESNIIDTLPSGSFWFNVRALPQDFSSDTFDSMRLISHYRSNRSPVSPQSFTLTLFQGDFVAEHFKGNILLSTDNTNLSLIDQIHYEKANHGNMYIPNAFQFDLSENGINRSSMIQISHDQLDNVDSPNQVIFTGIADSNPIDSFAMIITSNPNELEFFSSLSLLSLDLKIILFDKNLSVKKITEEDMENITLSLSIVSSEGRNLPLFLESKLTQFISSHEISSNYLSAKVNIPFENLSTEGLFIMQNSDDHENIVKAIVTFSKNTDTLSDAILLRIKTKNTISL